MDDGKKKTPPGRDLMRFAPLAILVLAVFIRLLPGERIVDDAYITYRYARNLVEGAGFVYNPGERVLGTTTPLYTLLLAGLALLLRTDHYPALSIGVNALADGAACALLLPLGQQLSGARRVGAAAGILYAIAPFSVTFAIGGMETSVFVLMLVLTALLYLRSHPAWALTAALALLTRPDALILIGPLGLDFSLRWLVALRAEGKGRSERWAALWRPALLFVLPLLPWVLFSTFYFGSPIPHSIAAKTAAYALKPAEGFIRLLQHYSTPFFEQMTFPSTPALLSALIAYLSLSIIGLLSIVRRDSRTLPITLFPFLYFAAFAIANPLIFRWYLTPPLPFYLLLILSGLFSVVQGLTSRIGDRRVSRILYALPVLFFIVLSARAWVAAPDHGPRRPAPEMAWFKLEQIYARVGQDLAPEVTSQTVIAAGDIGALGYFSRARILDTLGLISPQSTRYYPLPADQRVITYAIAASLISDQDPDYVVFLEVYGRRTVLVDSRFRDRYRLREKIPTDIYGSDGMLIYERGALP
jgi:arabinofuranosyltransferase